jgi:hypothetical protein
MTCFSRLKNAALLLGITGCPPNFSAPRTPKAHLWFSGSVGQGNLSTAAKVVQLGSAVENCGMYILGRLSVTSAQVASRQGGGGLGGLPLFMCPHVIIIQACVSRPQTAPPSQGAGPMGGILWRYGAKGGPYGLLLLLLTWLGVLLSDLSRFYPGGQCHSCCGERAHV